MGLCPGEAPGHVLRPGPLLAGGPAVHHFIPLTPGISVCQDSARQARHSLAGTQEPRALKQPGHLLTTHTPQIMPLNLEGPGDQTDLGPCSI